MFDRATDVFKFSLSALFCTLLSATIGVTSLAAGGYANWENYSAIWLTWWLADAIGALVVTPLILLWTDQPRWRFSLRVITKLLFCSSQSFWSANSFSAAGFQLTRPITPISFLCGPVVVWSAFRFSQRETATGVFMLSAIAAWGTLHHRGPFVMESEDQSLLIMNTSTAVLTVTALALAAAMSERRRAETAIEQQKAAVEAANKTKDNFLAMLSHELQHRSRPSWQLWTFSTEKNRRRKITRPRLQ